MATQNTVIDMCGENWKTEIVTTTIDGFIHNAQTIMCANTLHNVPAHFVVGQINNEQMTLANTTSGVSKYVSAGITSL